MTKTAKVKTSRVKSSRGIIRKGKSEKAHNHTVCEERCLGGGCIPDHFLHPSSADSFMVETGEFSYLNGYTRQELIDELKRYIGWYNEEHDKAFRLEGAYYRLNRQLIAASKVLPESQLDRILKITRLTHTCKKLRKPLDRNPILCYNICHKNQEGETYNDI